jgi:acyl carrier protein
MEDTVAAVWASVLRMDTAAAATAITRDSDFFDLGGHSLLLVKVAAGLQSGTGLEVSTVCSINDPVYQDHIQHAARTCSGVYYVIINVV